MPESMQAEFEQKLKEATEKAKAKEEYDEKWWKIREKEREKELAEVRMKESGEWDMI